MMHSPTTPLFNLELDKDTPGAAEKLAAFERVAVLLRENIISGTLRANQALPENELSAACGASRNTLREALRYLHGEGLVNYHQNRGVFVRMMDKRDVRDIYKVRRHLEVLALSVSPTVSPFHLQRMSSFLLQAEQAAANEQWRNVGTFSLRFHQAIVSMLASQRFNDFFSVILAQLRLLFASGQAEREFQYPWRLSPPACRYRYTRGELSSVIPWHKIFLVMFSACAMMQVYLP